MFSPETIPMTSQTDWSSQPAYTDIMYIDALGIDAATMELATQGNLVETSDKTRTLVSSGFGKCSALILRNADESWALAHAQPLDRDLYYKVKSLTKPIYQALFVFGGVSVDQYDLSLLLSERGVQVNSIKVDTGKAHFGIAFDVPTEKLTVVRITPDQSLLTYAPFKANSRSLQI